MQRAEAVAVTIPQPYLERIGDETNVQHDQATHPEPSRSIHYFLLFVLRPPGTLTLRSFGFTSG